MISEEALEAAAKAYYPYFWRPARPIEKYDTEPDWIKEECRRYVRPILEAAAPYMNPSMADKPYKQNENGNGE
jgi:hypothetical protein